MFDPSVTPEYIKAFIIATSAPFPIMYVVWLTKKLIFS